MLLLFIFLCVCVCECVRESMSVCVCICLSVHAIRSEENLQELVGSFFPPCAPQVELRSSGWVVSLYQLSRPTGSTVVF